MASEEPEKTGEGFASRWSRLKAEARANRPAEEKPESREVRDSRDAASAAAAIADAPAGLPDEKESEASLEELPRIEEIDATTDLTPWLKKKVPEAWRLAALRKSWSADPAIASFIGPSEYAWNYNEPESIAGFGPMPAFSDMAKLVAEATGVAEPKQQGDAAASQAVRDNAGSMRVAASEEPAKQSASVPAPKEEQTATGDTNSNEEPETAAFSPRRAGGALPV